MKGGAKGALTEDIEKCFTENMDKLENLDKKLEEIDSLIKGLESISQAMIGNPDYEMR